MQAEGKPGNTKTLVELELRDESRIAMLTLNDPERANAMSMGMGEGLAERVLELKELETLRCVVVHGSGEHFSIGGTRQMLSKLAGPELSFDDRKNYMLKFYDCWMSVLNLPVPVIGVIHGACIGVAPVWACLSDICVADENARFQITFASVGLYPGMALSYLLPRAVSPSVSSRLLLEGPAFSGKEAQSFGLAAKCAAPGKAMEIARGI